MDEQEGMRCITLMQPVYERCRELCELADSNPNYRLAVVDAFVTWDDIGTYKLERRKARSPHEALLLEAQQQAVKNLQMAYTQGAAEIYNAGYRRVVKMEGK